MGNRLGNGNWKIRNGDWRMRIGNKNGKKIRNLMHAMQTYFCLFFPLWFPSIFAGYGP